MGLLKGIKDKLGIQGVSIEIKVPGHVNANEDLQGSLILTTKSEQEIINIKIKVYEEFTSGRGNDQSTSEFVLGDFVLNDHFSIQKGDHKEIPFTIPFQISKSSNASLAEKGGVLGTIGKLGKFAAAENSNYFVKADVDVKSAFLDPTEKVAIKIVQ